MAGLPHSEVRLPHREVALPHSQVKKPHGEVLGIRRKAIQIKGFRPISQTLNRF